MEEKQLLELLDNKELMESVVQSCMCNNFYENDKKPVYSLKECLQEINDAILKNIYITYKHVFLKEKPKENPTRQEMIDILETNIMKTFSEFLFSLQSEDKEIIEEVVKYKKTEKTAISFLNNGFLYGFKEKGKTVYIMPNELVQLYKEYLNSDAYKENELHKATSYLMTCMLMYGVAPKKIVEKELIKSYSLDITEEQIKEIMKQHFGTYQNGKYYTIMQFEEEWGDTLEAIIKSQKSNDYKILNEEELNEYGETIHNLYIELEEVLKKNADQIISKMLILIFASHLELEELVDIVDIPPKKKDAVIEILECYQEDFRYWALGGRNIDEIKRETLVEYMLLKQKPNNENLDVCLTLISEEAKEELCEFYGIEDPKELEQEILKEAEEILDYCDNSEIIDLIEFNKTTIDNVMETSLIESGLVYLYQDEEEIKYYVPNDIQNILKNVVENHLEIDDMVELYVNMNGIIEKRKLQELLKEYHDIDIDIKGIDQICKQKDIYVIEKEYYTFIEDFPEDEIKEFMDRKKQFAHYKKIDVESDRKEQEFKLKLHSLLYGELNDEQADDVYHMVLNLVKIGVLSKESLDDILEENGISIPQSLKRKMIDLYKAYKKYISTWFTNGHSITELQSVNKSQKVGRNEPCPCGSGKKYKKCCGK